MLANNPSSSEDMPMTEESHSQMVASSHTPSSASVQTVRSLAEQPVEWLVEDSPSSKCGWANMPVNSSIKPSPVKTASMIEFEAQLESDRVFWIRPSDQVRDSPTADFVSHSKIMLG